VPVLGGAWDVARRLLPWRLCTTSLQFTISDADLLQGCSSGGYFDVSPGTQLQQASSGSVPHQLPCPAPCLHCPYATPWPRPARAVSLLAPASCTSWCIAPNWQLIVSLLILFEHSRPPQSFTD
jgi:hypothetical protein